MADAATAPRPAPGPPTGPLGQPAAGAIAPRGLRRYRAAAFQAYVLGAAVVFVVLAVVAHTIAYFPIDLTITHAVQAHHGQVFDGLMRAISWLGFFPQVAVLSGLVVLALFLSGLRWEAVAALFATLGGAVGALVKLVVLRPRPSADVVRVFRQLNSSGFPSGHVLSITAFGGFLAFLAFTLLKPSPGRTALIVALFLPIVLMGPSRIYLGQHWFSDVMGAYLFGSLWLALTTQLYRRGKGRFFAHQPLAPGAATAATGAARETGER